MTTKTSISFTIDSKVVKEFYSYAKKCSLNKSALMENLLIEYLKDKKNGTDK